MSDQKMALSILVQGTGAHPASWLRTDTQSDASTDIDYYIRIAFGKAGCSTCHQIAGHGKFIAEDLTDFATDHQASQIRGAILRPTGEAQDSATAVARNGRKFSGMIRNEDNASLQLQDGEGRLYLLMKSSLVSVQRKPGDPMPADYGQRLNATEIDDLVSYILGDGRAPASPSSGEDKRKENDEGPDVQD